MGGHPVKIIDPFTANANGEQGPFPFDMFERRYLAQGDSWFSFGAIPPTLTSNVLDELDLDRSTVIVNCARPGKVLAHMVDTTSETMFLRLLTGKLSMGWDGILISGAGNDVIDAATVGPDAPMDLRLLLTPAERGTGPLLGDEFISEPGWKTFSDHMTAVFARLIDRRDSSELNKGRPLFFHNYCRLMPRPAPAGPGFGPWLQPSLVNFSIPPNEWLAVANALIDRLRSLMAQIVAARRAIDPGCALHIVDTHQAQLELAEQTSAGRSGDFVNEIHPTRGGYRKVADVWEKSLNGLS